MSKPIIITVKGDNQFKVTGKEVEEAIDKIGTTAVEAEKEVSGLWASLNSGVGSMMSSLPNLSTVWGTAWSGIKKTVDVVTDTIKYTGIALTALGAAGTLALSGVISTGVDFEYQMAKVASVTGGGTEALEQLTDAARKMGRDSVFSASEAGEAMYYLASAGYSADQITESLGGTMALAGATMSDLASTTESVVSTLNQFGMEASESGRVSNVFAAAISKSQLEMSNLTEAMKYFGPVAGTVGLSLEETTAALGLLSNAGFKGSMAGAALRNIMGDLLKPTDIATEAFAKYGITLDQINPEAMGFADILQRLGSVGMSTADIMTIFGERGGPQMMALLNMGSEALRGMTASITGTNDAQRMLNETTDTVRGQWKLLLSAFQEIKLVIWDELQPVIKGLLEWLIPIVNTVGEWIKSQAGLVAWGSVVMTVIAAVVGPILTLIGAFTGLIAVMFLLAPIFLPLAMAFAGIVIAIWAVVEAVRQADIDWSHAWQHVLELTNTIFADLKTLFYSIIEEWFPAIQIGGDNFAAWWNENHDYLFQVAKEKWESIKVWITEKMQDIQKFWSEVISPLLQGDWQTAWNNLKDMANESLNSLLSEDLPAWWDSLRAWIAQEIMPGLETVGDTMGKAIGKALLKSLATVFLDIFAAVLGWLMDFANNFINWFLYGLPDSLPGFETGYRGWGQGNSSGGSWSANLPDDEWSYKRGGGAAPSRTVNFNGGVTFNVSGGDDPRKQARIIWSEIQRMAALGA